jgi:hypothetical protein
MPARLFPSVAEPRSPPALQIATWFVALMSLQNADTGQHLKLCEQWVLIGQGEAAGRLSCNGCFRGPLMAG